MLIRSVENLALCWRSLDDLCSPLTDEQWGRTTPCPGWTVKDTISHLIDYESRALGRPGPHHTVAEAPHVKNDLGASNEVGVDWRRGRTGAEVLDEFRQVTADRLIQLRALGPDDLDRAVTTPAGPGTVARMLTLRVMDTWSHEQDIRFALGRPGHDLGPAAAETVEYFATMLPYVVGKRAQAPEGATVVFEIDGHGVVPVEVAGGRAVRSATPPDEPTAVIGMDAVTFASYVNGRPSAGSEPRLRGDEDLGRRVIASLAVMV